MSRQTSKTAASIAARVLSDPNSSAAERSAAASALTQYQAAKEATSARAASRASAVLRDPTSSAAEKSAAASTLSQRADK
jgi:hypothetical protein